MRVRRVEEYMAVCDICGNEETVKLTEDMWKGNVSVAGYFMRKGWGGCKEKAVCPECEKSRAV